MFSYNGENDHNLIGKNLNLVGLVEMNETQSSGWCRNNNWRVSLWKDILCEAEKYLETEGSVISFLEEEDPNHPGW
jgi:hypothetical protein